MRTVHPGAIMFAFHPTPATLQVSKWHSIAFFQLGSWKIQLSDLDQRLHKISESD